MKEIYDFNDLINAFKMYILPTMESTHRNYNYIEQTIKRFTEIRNIPYIEINGKIALTKDNYFLLLEMFKLRYQYFNKEIVLYSTKDVGRILGVKNIDKIIKRGILTIATCINGQFYFNKEEVDNIKSSYENMYRIEELKEILFNKFSIEIDNKRLTYYVKKYGKFKQHPLSQKYGILIEKENLNEIINYIQNNITDKKIYQNDFSDSFKNYSVLYVGKMNGLDLLNYAHLRKCIKFYIKNKEKSVNLILDSCKELNIPVYTNKEHNDIFIEKKYINKYMEYFGGINFSKNKTKLLIEIGEIDLKNQYYTTDEVKELFKLKKVSSKLKEYAGFIHYKNYLYLEKEKIDYLNDIFSNYYSVSESINYLINKDYDITEKRFRPLINKLNLTTIVLKNTPIKSGIFIYKKDIKKVELYLDKQQRLKDSTTPYDIYKIKIEDVKVNSKMNNTLEIFNQYVLYRFKTTSSQYVVNALVEIYKLINLKFYKNIVECNDFIITDYFQYLETQAVEQQFTYFLNYCQENYQVSFEKKYEIEFEYEEIEPYSYQQWVTFANLLFNPNNDEFDILLKKAVKNRTSAMIWLYCSLHYVCGWRTSDIMNQFPIPDICMLLKTDNPSDVIKLIDEGNFTINHAQKVVNYVMTAVEFLDPAPEKTDRQILQMIISDSYIYIIGMLVALCAAHQKIIESKNNKKLNTTTLISERSTRVDAHQIFFGDIYLNIFGEKGFTNIRATKTYLSTIQTVSQENHWNTGYILSTIQRAHTTNKNGIAQTTQIYLNSLNKNQDVDMITYALAERGTFGFIYHQLMLALKEESYRELNINEQNELIEEILPLSPVEVESSIYSYRQYQTEVKEAVLQFLTQENVSIINILKKIMLGKAASKMKYSHCLLKVIEVEQKCIYPKKTECMGCKYLVTDMYFLIEYRKLIYELMKKMEHLEDDFDKRRYTYLLLRCYLPKLNEAVEFFGKERVSTFLNLEEIKLNITSLANKQKLLLEEV